MTALFDMFVYKGFTSKATENEFSRTLKLFVLFIKSLVSLIYGGISLTKGWRWLSTKPEISEVRQLIELMAGLPGLIYFCFLGVI